MSDYQAETPSEHLDLVLNANAYVSLMMNNREEAIQIWNAALELAISKEKYFNGYNIISASDIESLRL